MYYYSNGDQYIGNFKDGLQHGKGKYIYASGGFHEGEWMFGRKQIAGLVSLIGRDFDVSDNHYDVK
jgi:hypothetical protein